MGTEAALLTVHAGCTFAMTGLIWIVQLVHYPAFAFVATERFPEFHRFHCRRVSFIVVPLMLGELLTAIYLSLQNPAIFLPPSLLILVAWGSTFLLQVPYHARLELEFDEAAHGKLVGTNWIRTIAWTARSVWLLAPLS